MNRLTIFLVSFLIFSSLIGTPSSLAAGRVALVIGNGSYAKVPALPNPPRDSDDIGRALERLNFKVTKLVNANAAEMRKAIVDFGRTSEGSEMAVVFYAGHGMEVGGENWLIPIDAELRTDADIESEAVSLRSINLQVSKAHQLGLVILDACRNNPFAAKMKRSISTRAVARGLAPTEPTDNVLVAYAARDGTTANDGDGRNSPFTAALLRNIETPGLEISFLFRNVRDEVMSATKRDQQPFVYGSLSKEAIYLKPVAPPTVQVTVAPKSEPAPTEDERVWKTIKDSTDASLYDDFLRRYGYSPHVVDVRRRLADLKSTQLGKTAASTEAPDSTEDEKFWQAIKTSTVAGLYEEFLVRYAYSPHAADARQRLATLKSIQVAMAPTTASVLTSDPKRSLFTLEDTQRVAAMGTELKLKMPLYAIGQTKNDVPDSYRKFVGVWSSKIGFGGGKGRTAMLIVTEAISDGTVLGFYLYGPSTKSSWEKNTPAGYVDFVGKISDGTLRFKSGASPLEAQFRGSNTMTLHSTNIHKPSETSTIKFSPLWQLTPKDQAASPKR